MAARFRNWSRVVIVLGLLLSPAYGQSALNVIALDQRGDNRLHSKGLPRDLVTSWGSNVKDEILNKVPRDREISIQYSESDDTLSLAEQIHDFMESKGFRVSGIMMRDASAMPRGVSFDPEKSVISVAKP